MSDDRTDIPTLRRAVKDVVREAKAEVHFTPKDLHKRVKARFYRRLGELEHIYDKEAAFADAKVTAQLAGTEQITKWLNDPAFARWFLDEEYVVDSIQAGQQDAISVVMSVLKDDDASEGDRLKAARMLLELGDQFPGRKSEVRFLDDRLNQLTEGQTDKEIAKLEKAMGETLEGQLADTLSEANEATEDEAD